jgi:DNA primase
LIDFLFEKTTVKLDLNTARDKSHAVEKLLPVLAAIDEPVRQAHYLQKLAATVKVDMNTIKASLSRLKSTPARNRAGAIKTVPAGIQSTFKSGSREEYLLALLLQYPELKKLPHNFLPDYFEKSENREIYYAWQEAEDVTALKSRLDPAIHEHLDAITTRILPGTGNNVENRYADCVIELRKNFLRNLAARRAEAGEKDIDAARLEEDIEISNQLRELDIIKSKKRSSASGRTGR